MSAIKVRVSFEELNNGYVLVVKDHSGRVWSKGFGTKPELFDEAIKLELAEDNFSGSTHHHQIKNDALVDAEKLERSLTRVQQ